MKGWLKIKNAAEYADVCRSTISLWFEQGLEYREVGGCKRTKPEWIDQFIDSTGISTKRDIGKMVTAAMSR